MYRIFQLASLSFYYVLERGFICAPLAWPDTHPDSPPRGVDTAGVPWGVPWPPAHGFPQSSTPPTLLLPTVGSVWVVRTFFEEMWCPMKAAWAWAVVEREIPTAQAVPDGWRWHQPAWQELLAYGRVWKLVMPAGFPGKSLKAHVSRKSISSQIWGQNAHPPSLTQGRCSVSSQKGPEMEETPAQRPHFMEKMSQNDLGHHHRDFIHSRLRTSKLHNCIVGSWGCLEDQAGEGSWEERRTNKYLQLKKKKKKKEFMKNLMFG